MDTAVIASRNQGFIDDWRSCLEGRYAITVLPNVMAPDHGGQSAGLVIMDCLLLDIRRQPDRQSLRRMTRQQRVLIVGPAVDPQAELAYLACGAVGYCLASLKPEERVRICDTVLHGGIWVSRQLIPELMQRFRKLATPAAPAVSPVPAAATDIPASAIDQRLTSREREVALLVAKGASNKDIARTLNITDRTVKAHLTTIFSKLGVTDRVRLALLITERSQQQRTA